MAEDKKNNSKSEPLTMSTSSTLTKKSDKQTAAKPTGEKKAATPKKKAATPKPSGASKAQPKKEDKPSAPVQKSASPKASGQRGSPKTDRASEGGKAPMQSVIDNPARHPFEDKYDDSELEFMTPVSAAHLSKPSPMANIMLYSIVSFFVIAFAWAKLAEIDEVTRADGRVIPSSQIKMVDHLEGGIVKDILVREGEVVESGQVLLRIDNTVAQARYEEGVAHYYQAMAQVERLRAQTEGREFVMPQIVTREAPDVARKEMERYRSSVERLDNEKAIAAREVDQRRQELLETTGRVEQIKDRLELANEELKLTEPLVKAGVAPKVDLIRIRRDVNEAKGELASAKTNVTRAEAALKQAERRGSHVDAQMRNDDLRELREAESRWAEVQDALTTGKDRLTRTELRSPVRGTVKELLVNTIGGVIQPGQDLVAIVPLEDSLLIEAQVRPSDVAFLRPGLPAIIKITAYDFAVYGGMDGKLVDISADSIQDEKGQDFFRVRLRTDKNYLGRDETKPLYISVGMTASVDIKTGKKTVWEYIMKPIKRAWQNSMGER